MKMPAIDCLVIPESVPTAAARSELARLGMSPVDTLKGDGQRLSDEEVWTNTERSLAANLVEDPLVACRYIAVRGDKRETLIQELTHALGLITPAQSLVDAALTKSGSEQIRALYHVVVLFPAFNDEAFALLCKIATEHADDFVREATVDAMAYRAWPEFASVLTNIATSDRASSVRARAEQVLAFVLQRAAKL